MKIHNGKMRVGVLALAVEGALAAMCAMPVHAADDEDAAVLKTPTNFVEIGASNVSRGSAKFGEYNGLNDSGAYFIGNFGVRGGDAYGDGNGTMRWEVNGNDLGTTSRSLGGSVNDQGRWSLGIGYDELRHNLTDSYQTPYQGSMGGNSFTLPATFGVVSSTPSGTRVLNPAQQAAFHAVEVGTTRKNTSFSAGFNFNRQWGLKFDYNHLDQSGAKLMAFGSAGNGTAIAPGITGQAVSILPNPTDYKTDTVNLALNWAGDKGHMTGSYFGSFFREGYDRVTFQTYAVTGASVASAIQTMSTAPSNDFHQFNLTGGYAFSPKTKLAGGLSYGRNTQNDPFVVDPMMMRTPAQKSSLDGLVVTTHADLKLTDQTARDLVLSAGIKYDERDNRTSSNMYDFHSLAVSAGTAANYPNTPLSNKKTQLELAGDYRLSKNQHVRLTYNREDVRRWCNQYAVGVGYPAGTNCVVATASKDDKLSATYRLKVDEDVNLNVGYAYSKRKTDSDPTAIAAFALASKIAGTPNGTNANDWLGFHPYFNASRTQQALKAGVNWQAHDKLSLGLSGRYTDDDYDTTYGVQKGNSWSLNLDVTYSYKEDGSVSAYLTQEHRQRDLTDASSLTQNWTNKLKDDDTTLGLGVKQGGLMGGKLQLAGDLTYSLGKTAYGTQFNYANPACSTAANLTCGDLPDIKNTLIQFKLTGNYQVDKSAKVALGYLYQHLKSDDYYYNGLQYGFTPTTLMPTNQQTGSYSVNVVTASYIYTFR